MLMERLSYDERIAGWNGLRAAMERVRKTREPHTVRVFKSFVVDFSFEYACYVAGRIIIQPDSESDSNITLFELDGRVLCSVPIPNLYISICVILDRWVIITSLLCVCVLDCITCTTHKIIDGEHMLRCAHVSGNVLSCRMENAVGLYRFDLDSSIPMLVTTITLRHSASPFTLCNNGTCYVMETDERMLALFRVDNRQMIRTFNISPLSLIWHLREHSGYIIAPCLNNFSQYLAFRIADGRVSDGTFYYRDRILMQTATNGIHNSELGDIDLNRGIFLCSQSWFSTIEIDLSSGVYIKKVDNTFFASNNSRIACGHWGVETQSLKYGVLIYTIGKRVHIMKMY
jgi:hypothetical protein